MTKLLDDMINLADDFGTIVAVFGGLTAIWSFIRTRSIYYQDYKRRKRK